MSVLLELNRDESQKIADEQKISPGEPHRRPRKGKFDAKTKMSGVM